MGKVCLVSTLLVSDSGEGKTYQLGEIATWWFRKTGGKYEKGQLTGGQRTILYAADFGGWSVIKPAVTLGIVHLVNLTNRELSFQWLDRISRGLIPGELDGPQMPWGPPPAAMFGDAPHYAYDSMTSMANIQMLALAAKSASGQNIGGGSGYKFTEGDMTIASNNPTHYNLTQNAIMRAVANSHFATVGPVTWTARLRRTEEEGMAPVLGPQIAGKAMTPELPAWFTYTFRLAQEVTMGAANVHVLYHEDHKDMTAPGAKVLANSRMPKGAVALPPKQVPADVPKMLDAIMEGAQAQALDALKKELSTPVKTIFDVNSL
jgi:hypothetical protein